MFEVGKKYFIFSHGLQAADIEILAIDNDEIIVKMPNGMEFTMIKNNICYYYEWTEEAKKVAEERAIKAQVAQNPTIVPVKGSKLIPFPKR